MEREAVITCPECKGRRREVMPADSCQFFYECPCAALDFDHARGIAASFAPLVASLQEALAVSLENEKARLLQRDSEWARLASVGVDVEAMISYWTDDAVVLPPGLPAVVGKAALREYVRACLRIPGFKITWTSTEVRLSPDGELAYMFSQNAVTMNSADGEPATTRGRAVTIWRRDPDGVWRCAVDVWNAEPAP